MCTLPASPSRRRAHSLAIRRAPRRPRDGWPPNVHIGLEAVVGPRGVLRRMRRQCAHCRGISRAAFLISATERPPMCTLAISSSRRPRGKRRQCAHCSGIRRSLSGPRDGIAGSVRRVARKPLVVCVSRDGSFPNVHIRLEPVAPAYTLPRDPSRAPMSLRRMRRQCAHFLRPRRSRVRTTSEPVAFPCGGGRVSCQRGEEASGMEPVW